MCIRDSFSLSWDDPFVRFGRKATGSPTTATNPVVDEERSEAPMHARYYSRFFGTSGLASPAMGAYALIHRKDWVERIQRWQEDTISRAGCMGEGGDGASFYDAQLFNELYFLVDGGTVWVDSSVGAPNNTAVSIRTSTGARANGAPSRRQQDDSGVASELRKAQGARGSSDALLQSMNGTSVH